MLARVSEMLQSLSEGIRRLVSITAPVLCIYIELRLTEL